MARKDINSELLSSIKNVEDYIPRGYVKIVQERLKKKKMKYAVISIIRTKNGKQNNDTILEILIDIAKERKAKVERLKEETSKF